MNESGLKGTNLNFSGRVKRSNMLPLTIHERNARSWIIGAHSDASHLSFSFFACAAHGVRQSKTTTESPFAGMYPRRKMFLHPQEKHSSTVSPSCPSLCKLTSLHLARTKWLIMWDPLVFPRPLQNHWLPVKTLPLHTYIYRGERV